MKKVLLVIPACNHGGTNRSLLNLLNTIDQSKYSFQILAMDLRGPYKEKLKNFNLLPEDSILSAVSSFGNPFKTDGSAVAMKRLFWKTIYKIVFKGKEETLFRFASKKHNKRQYDVVIAFQEGRATHFTSQIAASLHIAWVRCDYTNYQKIVCSRNECAIYDKYDHIVCVSDYTANVFRKVYPALVERTCAIHNLIDTRGIIASSMDALDKTEFDHDRFTLVSVGRMDPVKRFSHIPLIARKMKQSGCIFKWYLIGSGGEEFNKVRERIKEYGIGTEVVLLGAKDNPYPYIANADILVCPSYSEACPNVVNEAKILHVPVVAADFPSAKEYVNSGVDGIVSPLDEIADVLIKLYNDNEEYTRLKNGIFHFHYDNNEIKRKVEALLDGEFE